MTKAEIEQQFISLNSQLANITQMLAGMAKPEAVASPTIGAAIDRLIESKRLAGRREIYLKGLKYYLTQFARGREGVPLNRFTSQEITDWFEARQEIPVTRAANIGRLKSLFTFAVRKGWMERSPCAVIDQVIIDRKPPAILTPGQQRDLLQSVSRRCRPYLILTMLAGVRPDEVKYLKWGDVNLERGLLTIDRSKTRRRRIVPLHPLAVHWLKQCDDKIPIYPSRMTIRRWRAKARVLLNGWPQDILRHTAASYLLALHGDAGKVAFMLGNSADILLQHYHQLVSAEDCAEFWKIPE